MALAKLSIDLEARLVNLQRDMDKAGRIAEKNASRMSKAFDGAKLAAGAIGGALLSALSVTAITQFVRTSIDAADAASKQAKGVGLLVEELTGLQFAAELSGVSNEDLTKSLAVLARRSKDASDGVKESADAFAELGVKVTTNDGKLKGTTELLKDLADAFEALPGGVRKTALAQDVFGRSGARLIPFLNEGRAGLERLTAEAERLGLVISTETAVAAEALNDNITRLKRNFTGLSNELAAAVVPALNEYVVRILAATQSFDSLGDFLSTILSDGNAFASAADGVDSLNERLRDLREQRDRLAKGGSIFDAINAGRVQEQIGEAEQLLEYYQRIASQLGELGAGAGRGFINPPSALSGKTAKEPSKLTAAQERAAEEQRRLSFFLSDFGSEESNAELARLQRYDEVLAALPKRIEEVTAAQTAQQELVQDFLRSEKSAYGQTDEQVAALLENIGKLDERTAQFLENVQNAFGDTILKSLKSDFDGILGLWSDLLLRMVAEAAAADLASALGGKGGGGNLASLGSSIIDALGFVFGGGRAIGGQTRRGQLVEVNELGGPGELLSAGGKQYLLPNSNGYISPTTQQPGAYAGVAPGGGSINLAPVTNVYADARTDRAELLQVVRQSVALSQQGMWQQLRARGVV